MFSWTTHVLLTIRQWFPHLIWIDPFFGHNYNSSHSFILLIASFAEGRWFNPFLCQIFTPCFRCCVLWNVQAHPKKGHWDWLALTKSKILTFDECNYVTTKNSQNWELKSTKRFEHIELPAKLLDYFLRSNKSNINQSHWSSWVCWMTSRALRVWYAVLSAAYTQRYCDFQ